MPRSESTGDVWKHLLTRSGFRPGGSRALLLNLLAIACFGLLVPWLRGFDFFDAFLIVSYSAIALLFAASAVTDLVAAGDTGPTLAPAIFASALHGSVVLTLIYALGIACVNLIFRAPRLLHPNWRLLGASLLFALCGGTFLAAFTAMLSVVFSPPASRAATRAIFILMLLGVVFGPRYLSPEWQFAISRQMTTGGLTRIALIGAAVAGVLAAGLLFALRKPRVESEPG